MNLDKISVIVPVYNAEKYLSKCISSILKQTYKNLEIILVDDGSTDSSNVLCDYFAKNDQRVKVIHKKNEGLTLARKSGVAVAEGEFVGFVDADDWIEENMYSQLYSALNHYNADIANCRFIKEYPNGSVEISSGLDRVCVFTASEAIEEMNSETVVEASLANKLIRKKLFDEVPFRAAVTIGEDYRTNYYLMHSAKNVVCIPDVCYHYIQHLSSMCAQGYSGNGNAILDSYIEIKKQIFKNYANQKYSALRYCILQEMAVIISMIKSNNYDLEIIKKVKKDVRENLIHYLIHTNSPIHLKICALLLSIHEKFLIYPYKWLFLKIFRTRMEV